MAATHIAFLRGINVGGKNLIKMPALKAHFEALGLENVSTYLQSGNVLFTAKSKRLPIEYGLEVPVVVFSGEELAEVIRNNPFPEATADPAKLLVMFLATSPTENQVAGLDPNRSRLDRFRVVNRQIYIQLARGAADTKLTNAYFDSKLKTVSTGRNWRTVTTIFELMQ
jgi:uncharacterized protein (DUF1697 family)